MPGVFVPELGGQLVLGGPGGGCRQGVLVQVDADQAGARRIGIIQAEQIGQRAAGQADQRHARPQGLLELRVEDAEARPRGDGGRQAFEQQALDGLARAGALADHHVGPMGVQAAMGQQEVAQVAVGDGMQQFDLAADGPAGQVAHESEAGLDVAGRAAAAVAEILGVVGHGG